MRCTRRRTRPARWIRDSPAWTGRREVFEPPTGLGEPLRRLSDPCATYDGDVMPFDDDFHDALALILGSELPAPEGETMPFYRQWLAEQNLGLVPVALSLIHI